MPKRLLLVLLKVVFNENKAVLRLFHGIVTVKSFEKYEKLEYKKNQLKLDIDFLSNCKQLGVYPKFLILKLPNVPNKDASPVRKRLLCSAINKHNKELQHLSKELSLPENFLSTHTAFYY